jgi:hypothetical protein
MAKSICTALYLAARRCLGLSASADEGPVAERLIELFEADQADRRPGPDRFDWAVVCRRYEQRRAEVLSIMRTRGLRSAEDYYRAARMFRCGTSTDDVRLAFSLAWIASALDPEDRRARWLSAAAWDRIMVHQGMPQWYGTQFRRRADDAPWELYELDESAVTDEDRAKLGVESLEQAQERATRMNQ